MQRRGTTISTCADRVRKSLQTKMPSPNMSTPPAMKGAAERVICLRSQSEEVCSRTLETPPSLAAHPSCDLASPGSDFLLPAFAIWSCVAPQTADKNAVEWNGIA